MIKRALYDLFFFALAIVLTFLTGIILVSFGLLIFAIVFLLSGTILSIISAKLSKEKERKHD